MPPIKGRGAYGNGKKSMVPPMISWKKNSHMFMVEQKVFFFLNIRLCLIFRSNSSRLTTSLIITNHPANFVFLKYVISFMYTLNRDDHKVSYYSAYINIMSVTTPILYHIKHTLWPKIQPCNKNSAQSIPTFNAYLKKKVTNFLRLQ